MECEADRDRGIAPLEKENLRLQQHKNYAIKSTFKETKGTLVAFSFIVLLFVAIGRFTGLWADLLFMFIPLAVLIGAAEARHLLSKVRAAKQSTIKLQDAKLKFEKETFQRLLPPSPQEDVD